MGKVRYALFAFLLIALYFLLCDTLKPCFTAEDIVGAQFTLYTKGVPVSRLEWNQFSNNDKELLICWVNGLPRRSRFAITDYAPGLCVRSSRITINVVERRVIVDYRTRWLNCARQIICRRTEIDDAIFNLVEKRMIGQHNSNLDQ